MNTETLNQIKETLAPIADKIGQGAEFTWEVMVKQQLLQGWIMLGAFIFSIIGLIVGLIIFKNGEEDLGGVMAIACGVLGFCFLLVLLLNGITQIINPEYHAIMDLIRSVK